MYTGETPPDVEKPDGPYPVVITQSSGKKVPVVQAYAYAKYLGRLHLAFDGNGDLVEWDGEPILLDGSVPRESDVLQLLELYRPGVVEYQSLFVGKSMVLLNGDKGSCRAVECSMGNLIADSRVHVYIKRFNSTNDMWSDTSIALIQGGGIRSSISRGQNITAYDLMSVLPFGNALVKVNVSATLS